MKKILLQNKNRQQWKEIFDENYLLVHSYLDKYKPEIIDITDQKIKIYDKIFVDQEKSLFEDSLWEVQFYQQFLEQISIYKLLDALTICKIISQGYFGRQTEMIYQTVNFCSYYEVKCSDFNIVFRVCITKEPIIERNKICQFSYHHKIIFLDIYSNGLRIDISELEAMRQKNPYTTDYSSGNKIAGSIFIAKQQTQQKNVLLYKIFDEQNESWGHLEFLKSEQLICWQPMSFLDQKVDYRQYDFKDQYYISNDQLKALKFKIYQDKQRIKNQKVMQKMSSEQSKTIILKIFEAENIQGLRFNKQEYDLIESDNNQIVIGRSGTGKTTCSLLKIILTQLQYQQHLRLYGNFQLSDQNSQNTLVQLKCIYITLNRQLAHYVAPQYLEYILNLQKYIQSSNQNQGLAQIINDLASIYSNSDSKVKLSDAQINFVEVDELIVNSLSELDPRMYPAFFNIHQLYKLIDQCFEEPFFTQQKFINKKVNRRLAQWNNGNIIKIQQTVNGNWINALKQNLVDQTLPIVYIDEIEYQNFRDQFWLQSGMIEHHVQNDMSYCNLIWTQIYSYIKGSEYSHQYPQSYLPFVIYSEQQQYNFPPEELRRIYNYFIAYEIWKERNGHFDMLDITNYLLNQYDKGLYRGPSIHCSFVDEVQDFPNAILKLLSKFTEQYLYMCGDTAQNIQKGVGFRFQDLRSIVKQSEFANKLQCYQLTVNFRTHNNLLQFANSIVSLLDLFFPKTIDKLNKEYSDLDGPKAMIVNKVNLLPQILSKCSQSEYKIEFGVQSAILVKDENSKSKLPDSLQNALIFTIFEAKGQEFDDVVIYNFFSDSAIPDKQWDLLKNIIFTDNEIDEQIFASQISNHNQYELLDFKQFYNIKNINGKLFKDKICLPQNFLIEQNIHYSLLCNELKMLYVAITRARNRILIYDENPKNRVIIEKFWQSQNLILHIDKASDIPEFIKRHRTQVQMKEQDQEQWKKQGLRLFYQKLYSQAHKCFKNAGEDKLALAAKGFEEASMNELNSFNLDQKTRKEQKLDAFNHAAKYFLDADMKEQAAQCWFEAELYEKAFDLNLSLNLIIQAKQCALELQYFTTAAILSLYLKQYNDAFQESILTANFRFTHLIFNTHFTQLSPIIVKQYIQKQYLRFLKVIFIENCFNTLKIDKYELNLSKYDTIQKNDEGIQKIKNHKLISDQIKFYNSTEVQNQVINLQDFISQVNEFKNKYQSNFNQILYPFRILYYQKEQPLAQDERIKQVLELLLFYDLVPIQIAIILQYNLLSNNTLLIFSEFLHISNAKNLRYNHINISYFRSKILMQGTFKSHFNSIELFAMIQTGNLLSLSDFLDESQALIYKRYKQKSELHSILNQQIQQINNIFYLQENIQRQHKKKDNRRITAILDILSEFDEVSFNVKKCNIRTSIHDLFKFIVHMDDNDDDSMEIILTLTQEQYYTFAKYIWLIANLFQYRNSIRKQIYVFDILCEVYDIIQQGYGLSDFSNYQYCYINKQNPLLKDKDYKINFINIHSDIAQYRTADLIEMLQQEFAYKLEYFNEQYLEHNKEEMADLDFLDFYSCFWEKQKEKDNDNRPQFSKKLIQLYEIQQLKYFMPTLITKIKIEKELSKKLYENLCDMYLEVLVDLVDLQQEDYFNDLFMVFLLPSTWYQRFYYVNSLIYSIGQIRNLVNTKRINRLKYLLDYSQHQYLRELCYSFEFTQHFLKFKDICIQSQCSKVRVKNLDQNILNLIILNQQIPLYQKSKYQQKQSPEIYQLELNNYKKSEQRQIIIPESYKIKTNCKLIKFQYSQQIVNTQIKQLVRDLIDLIVLYYRSGLIEQYYFIQYFIWISLNFDDVNIIYTIVLQELTTQHDDELTELLSFQNINIEDRFEKLKQPDSILGKMENFIKVQIQTEQIIDKVILLESNGQINSLDYFAFKQIQLEQCPSLVIVQHLYFQPKLNSKHNSVMRQLIDNEKIKGLIYKIDDLRTKMIQVLVAYKDSMSFYSYHCLVQSMKTFDQLQSEFYEIGSYLQQDSISHQYFQYFLTLDNNISRLRQDFDQLRIHIQNDMISEYHIDSEQQRDLSQYKQKN